MRSHSFVVALFTLTGCFPAMDAKSLHGVGTPNPDSRKDEYQTAIDGQELTVETYYTQGSNHFSSWARTPIEKGNIDADLKARLKDIELRAADIVAKQKCPAGYQTLASGMGSEIWSVRNIKSLEYDYLLQYECTS